jgi:hypothetical protein
MPATAYKVEWISNNIPSEMAAGTTQAINVTFKNTGDRTWPSKGSGPKMINAVLVSYHWLQGSTPIVFDGMRTPLPNDVAAGQKATVDNITIAVPKTPGPYRLQVSFVHEGVTWFDWNGSFTPLTVPVTVR